MAAGVIETVFEVVIRDGIKYLVKKATDSLGKAIRQFFRDENDDGVPDTEEPEFTEDDEETSGEQGESDTDEPIVTPPSVTTSDTTTYPEIVLITPDGPIVMADNTTSDYQALCSQATEYWIDKYGATSKPFTQYSVTECLLFIIAVISIFFFVCKIFKRRKF